MSTKVHVLDSSTLLSEPDAIQSLNRFLVVISIETIDQLIREAGKDDESSKRARQALRTIERYLADGAWADGIPLSGEGILSILCDSADYGGEDRRSSSELERTIQICNKIQASGQQPVLVTSDIRTMIQAKVLGIELEEIHEYRLPPLHLLYSGRAKVIAQDQWISQFHRIGMVKESIYTLDEQKRKIPYIPEINQFLYIQSSQAFKKSVLGRYDGDRIVPLEKLASQPCGLIPKNAGQRFLQEALLTDTAHAPLVIVKGPSGTAKSLYTLAVGVSQIADEKSPAYWKILISRHGDEAGEFQGRLSSMEIQSIAELLMRSDEHNSANDGGTKRAQPDWQSRKKVNGWILEDRIMVEDLSRCSKSIVSQTYWIVDNAQNLSRQQIRELVARVGHQTKLVLVGNPEHIENTMLGNRANGLSIASEIFKGSSLCWQISLQLDECDRSPISEDSLKRGL